MCSRKLIAGKPIFAIVLLMIGASPSKGSAQPIDSDADSVPDEFDNCPDDFNPGQEDSEGSPWTLDGTLPSSLSSQGVVPVENGVFIFGGAHQGTILPSSYIYHLGGGLTPMADMPGARHTVGYVKHNGRVYCIAGHDPATAFPPDWSRSKNLWSYDPNADPPELVWTIHTALTYARDSVGAASLGDFIYTIGGHHEETGHGFSISRVERIDPDTGNPWEPVAPLNQDDRPGPGGLPLGRQSLAVAVVGEHIFAIGGQSGEKNVHASEWGDWIEVYDPQADTWDDSLQPMPTARTGAAVTVVDTRIYIIGGEFQNGIYTDAVEYYDVSDAQWHTDTSFPIRMAGARAVTIDNKIYVLGGVSYPDYQQLDTVSCWHLPMGLATSAITARSISIRTKRTRMVMASAMRAMMASRRDFAATELVIRTRIFVNVQPIAMSSAARRMTTSSPELGRSLC